MATVKVLIACEFSGVIRDAFTARGHDAASCDLLPSDRPGRHFKRDIFTADGLWNLPTDFDLMIAHPPCTHLSVSGARWFEKRPVQQQEAIRFFMALVDAPVNRFCIENPVGVMSTLYRKPDQIIQPWQFGHAESKMTCLWLNNLPPLRPTCVMELPGSGRWSNQTPSGQNNIGPRPDRWKLRSRTYEGIAAAMAQQWGSI